MFPTGGLPYCPPVGPDFATNGEQTATNPFAVYGERAQLLMRGGHS